MMRGILVIDDERTLPLPDAIYARTSDDAFALLDCADAGWDEVWFDHDLGGADTTRPVALWLAQRAHDGHPVPIVEVFVHSMNPVGADWLLSTLGRWYPTFRVLPAVA